MIRWLITYLTRGQGTEALILLLFFCQFRGVLQSSQDFDKFFFFSLNVETTGVSWKVDQTTLFVFCQIDELLLAALLACNQSFSTFPIWVWDISDLYIFDDLHSTWWIVFRVMTNGSFTESTLKISSYLILIFLINFLWRFWLARTIFYMLSFSSLHSFITRSVKKNNF